MAEKNNDVPVVRCAVYTRKSTEEGLDQDFNSLDAQREAGENYIASQRGEGWECLPTRYDDGGYSGGDTDRPALLRLMRDVEADEVDCITVYKVDRFSRSLLDFAKMMERLEEHGVSFVSVTQHFNTATSMGRLILNILLSFAQFERDMISERTRDKIAAARRRGKWIGGHPVLGYDIASKGGRLLINKEEAEVVRTIFEIYVRRQGLLPALQDVKRRGWRNKAWVTRKGKMRGGRDFNKVTLHRLLTNVLYVGKVPYNEEVFEGEHEAIVSEKLWDSVQSILERNRRRKQGASKRKDSSLLAGVLRCARCGAAMTHHYTAKGKRRYRYYVCINRMKNGKDACPDGALPAQQIENFVIEQLAQHRPGDNDTLSRALENFSAIWQGSFLPEKHDAFRKIVERVECNVGEGRLGIQLRLNGIKRSADSPPAQGKSNAVLERRFYFRTGPYGQKRMAVGIKPDPLQVRPGRIRRASRLMALAIHFDKLVRSNGVENYAELARLGQVTRARVTQIMNLLNLAPDIQEEILFLPRVNGRRDGITIRELQPVAAEPDWEKQRGMWSRLTGSLV